ncbi:HvfC family RiPP maturation protein [Shewanella cyperi]|uniref:HvfC family RiPP maturation protein n=1 Tax=Shewanella cyperi TaxID=2814292 RepID=UPI001A9476B3|nr:putative DNA-binding domain-containing protein [Shewanella cyperi]QSX42091.1 putative DNA-binding domain-containing protein [Shewanella cyperi]
MSFISIQQQFIEAIKAPDMAVPTDVPEARMAVYRELFFNNVEGFVSSAFPVLKSLYTAGDWLQLVRLFFRKHDCQSPLFVDIAGEFLAFLQQEYQPTELDPPFMLELAHYEWLELVVSIAQTPDHEGPLTGDIGSAPLLLASHAKVVQYHYEVQRIRADFRPAAPAAEPLFFCVYRDADDRVCFLRLNPLTAQALALLAERPGLDLGALNQALSELYHTLDEETLAAGLWQLLQQLADKGIIQQKLK